MDEKISLFGPFSVIGRAFVVRSKQVVRCSCLGLREVDCERCESRRELWQGSPYSLTAYSSCAKTILSHFRNKITTGFKRFLLFYRFIKREMIWDEALALQGKRAWKQGMQAHAWDAVLSVTRLATLVHLVAPFITINDTRAHFLNLIYCLWKY